MTVCFSVCTSQLGVHEGQSRLQELSSATKGGQQRKSRAEPQAIAQSQGAACSARRGARPTSTLQAAREVRGSFRQSCCRRPRESHMRVHYPRQLSEVKELCLSSILLTTRCFRQRPRRRVIHGSTLLDHRETSLLTSSSQPRAIHASQPSLQTAAVELSSYIAYDH